MKKIAVFFAVFFFACISMLRAADRDVLAHACGDWCWFARVSKVPTYLRYDNDAPTEQTEVFARENGPGQVWKPLLNHPLPGRVTGMANRSSQLAVLLKDGQWKTLWTNDSASGQPLPASGQMLTIADDGTDMWAIGTVPGGISAANEAIAQSGSTTRPTTVPTTGASTKSSNARLVVFKQSSGQWTTVAELPATNIIAPDFDLSLTIVNGCPMVAFRTTDRKIQIIRCDLERHWTNVSTIAAPTTQPAGDHSIQNFRLFSDGYDPYFWQSTGNGSGEMFVDVSEKSKAILLDWGKDDPLDGPPTAIFSNGFVCVLGPCGNKVVEHRYERSGKPFETAAALVVPGDGAERMLAPWLEIAFLCMMGFLVVSSVFQQWGQSEKPAVEVNVVPAALFPRFAAGLIDLLPIVGAISIILTFMGSSDELLQMPSIKTICVFAAGVVLYLLHTTIAEAWMSRSIGKWLMGLRVVTVQGNEPSRSQMLTRNLLRVVDPLVMILFSPLRQRSADTVAGTVVIEVDVEATPLTVTGDAEEKLEEFSESESADS